MNKYSKNCLSTPCEECPFVALPQLCDIAINKQYVSFRDIIKEGQKKSVLLNNELKHFKKELENETTTNN